MTDAEHDHLLADDLFPEWKYIPDMDGAPFEYEQSDWGYYQGRLVAVDCAAHELFERDEMPRQLE
ncbi:hypothetical protein [Methylobacterium nodulans]|nr:hypothetical protein [Methylobacterium nodulans]